MLSTAIRLDALELSYLQSPLPTRLPPPHSTRLARVPPQVAKELKFKSEEPSDAAAAELYAATMTELEAAFPAHLPLLLERLSRANAVEGDARTAEAMAAVVTAADKVGLT